MNSKGAYFVSKYKSSLGKSFGNSIRPSIADSKGYPGPGMYVSPSDFPHPRNSRRRSSVGGNALKRMKKSHKESTDMGEKSTKII